MTNDEEDTLAEGDSADGPLGFRLRWSGSRSYANSHNRVSGDNCANPYDRANRHVPTAGHRYPDVGCHPAES